jgi:hypothetical protein
MKLRRGDWFSRKSMLIQINKPCPQAVHMPWLSGNSYKFVSGWLFFSRVNVDNPSNSDLQSVFIVLGDCIPESRHFINND